MSIKEYPPHPPQDSLHIPVLLDAAIELLDPKPGESYLDLTAGFGGHANAILEQTGNYSESVLVDRDETAIEHLEASIEPIRIMHTDFVSAANSLLKEGRQFDIVMVDLGVSSPQLDQSERGFSLKNEGPLDMRMDRRQTATADQLVNEASAAELTRIISEFGEEPSHVAKTIAKAIVDARPIKSTKQLADLIKEIYRGRKSKIHPATRTFQSLRIAVNDELGQVKSLLPMLPSLLKPGGRVAIISFHSLEDRLVKRYFKDQQQSGFETEILPITKKPVSGEKYDHNPRARSAKLRAAVKI